MLGREPPCKQPRLASPAEQTSPPAEGNAQVRLEPTRSTQRHLAVNPAKVRNHCRQRVLHLQPCTYYQYWNLDDETRSAYDCVEGILLWREMPDQEHQKIASFLKHNLVLVHARHQAHISVDTEVNLEIPSRKQALVAAPCSSPGKSSSSEASGSTAESGPTVRRGDVVVGRYLSKAEVQCASPRTRKVPYNIGKDPPQMVFEIVSPSTKDVDYNDKWIEYARAGISEYIIVRRCRSSDDVLHSECENGEHTGSVIVGTLSQNDNVSYTANPLPSQTGQVRRSSRNRQEAKYRVPGYERKEYRNGDLVKCSYLSSLGLTARNILAPEPGEDIMQGALDKKDTQIQQKDAQIQQHGAQIQQYGAQIQQKDAQIQQYGAQIQQYGAQIQQKDAQLREANREIARLKRERERHEKSRKEKGSSAASSSSGVDSSSKSPPTSPSVSSKSPPHKAKKSSEKGKSRKS